METTPREVEQALEGCLDALCLTSFFPASMLCRWEGEWGLPWSCPDLSWEKGIDLSSFSDKI